MNNDEVLRRLGHAFALTEARMVEIFALAGHELTVEQVRELMHQEEEDQGSSCCSDARLAQFLDGVIIDRRGPREPGAPQPASLPKLTNNTILKKLRIALALHEKDVLNILAAGGIASSKEALSPLFRNPGNKRFRSCGDEVLDAFLKGLT